MRAIAILVFTLTMPATAQDSIVARGEQLFACCSACHSLTPDDEGLQGPSLAGIVGSRVGSRAGFPYTDVFIRMRDEGAVWTAEALNAFLADPLTFAPGNAMDFFGMPNLGDRADLIAYLEAVSDGSR